MSKVFDTYIFNDHKEKPQSFEAKLCDEFYDLGGSHFSIDATGYGANEEEAKKELKKCMAKMIEMLDATIKKPFIT